MYQIRKCQEIVTYHCSPVSTVDPEKFRNLSIAYTGNSEKEFLEYLNNLYLDDIYDELDEDTQIELSSFYEPEEWEEYFNSTNKGENSWHEIGEVNEEYTKTGGFDARHSTLGDC
jgi:hypothetical protein